MKKLLFAFVLISNVVVAQSELPKCIDVYITEFTQYYKYSDVYIDEAISHPDSVSYETTDCHYVIDFNRNVCELYYQNTIVGSAPIMVVLQESSKIFIKLAAAADDTDVVIDIENGVFIYSHSVYMNRIVQLPTKFTITSTKF